MDVCMYRKRLPIVRPSMDPRTTIIRTQLLVMRLDSINGPKGWFPNIFIEHKYVPVGVCTLPFLEKIGSEIRTRVCVILSPGVVS